MSDSKNPSDDISADDLWAEAMNEQTGSGSAPAASENVFKAFESAGASGAMQDIDLIMDIPVKLTVELGRTKMTIKELLRLTQGSVVSLDGLAGEPLDILINGYLIAHFAETSMRLSRILQLKPGDVLPIDKPDRIIAHVDGVPVLTSQYGTVNGQYALRVEHLINPILNSLNEEQPK